MNKSFGGTFKFPIKSRNNYNDYDTFVKDFTSRYGKVSFPEPPKQ